jgi:hypothetical protein
VRLAEELAEVRRSVRAELVPYRGGQLVRAADVRSPFRLPPRRGADDAA